MTKDGTASGCGAVTCGTSESGNLTIEKVENGVVTGTLDIHFDDGSSAKGRFRVVRCSGQRRCG